MLLSIFVVVINWLYILKYVYNEYYKKFCDVVSY